MKETLKGYIPLNEINEALRLKRVEHFTEMLKA